MEDYKKKYEEALEKAKMSYHTGDYDKDTLEMLEIIFPELAESNGEKVRKALLEMVHDTTGDELWIDYNVHKEEALAWLEKQGEHANFRDKIQVGDKVTRNEDGVLVNLSQLKRVAKPSEGKQKPVDSYCQENCKGFQETGKCFADGGCKAKREAEQKPIEQQMYWTEEEIEPIISDYLCGREHYGGMMGRLCHLKPKQKQTEWSEDDEAFLDDILCKLEHDLILNKDEKDWLKSLKQRIQKGE